jgi:hypothetical protein
LTSFDIKDGFDNPRVLDLPQLTLDDIELILVRYDRDNDRRLKFSEFSYAFSPIDTFYKEKLAVRKGSEFGGFNDKTLLIYRNLWLTQI